MKAARALTAAAFVVLTGLAGRADAQLITEFRVPSGGSPLSIAAGRGGMWFTESGQSRVGRIAADGTVTEFTLHRPALGIVTGPDGNLWMTSRGFLTRMTPAGDVTDFPITVTTSSAGITVGPDGNIWFTGYGIGRATLDGRITEFKAGDEPDGITAGPDGNLWFADFAEDYGQASFVGHQVGRITPSGVVVEFPIERAGAPRNGGAPRKIAAAPDGNLWLALEGGTKNVVRITSSGDMTAFPAPNAYDIVAGLDGGLWFTERLENRIGRISTGGDFVGFAVPTPTSRPTGIAVAPDGDIWFTEALAGQIGRIHLGAAEGDTLTLAGTRFQVSVSLLTPDDYGRFAAARPVPVSRASGYFWFFDPASAEVFVKVVDGCAINGRTWLFVAGLTDLNVLVTVTDASTGVSKVYVNPGGVAFASIQDTDTFSGCLGSAIPEQIRGLNRAANGVRSKIDSD